jgi:hypothetical protein
MSSSTLRGDRRHHERRVYARRSARTPGYAGKHAGKTPGKYCSGPCCGNPRRWYGDATRQECLATIDPIETLAVDTLWPGEQALVLCDAGACQLNGSGVPALVNPTGDDETRHSGHQRRIPP